MLALSFASGLNAVGIEMEKFAKLRGLSMQVSRCKSSPRIGSYSYKVLTAAEKLLSNSRLQILPEVIVINKPASCSETAH